MVIAHAGPPPIQGCNRPLGASLLVNHGNRSMSSGEKAAHSDLIVMSGSYQNRAPVRPRLDRDHDGAPEA
jgi:hypothetical protein